MASDIETIKGIERNLESMQPYDAWHIGLSRDPDQREIELGYPAFWRYWELDTPDQARRVKDFFLHKGMREDGEYGRKPVCVHLY